MLCHHDRLFKTHVKLYYIPNNRQTHFENVLGTLTPHNLITNNFQGETDLTGETGGAPPTYHSFLLRLWRESEQGPWRISLESVTTGERRGFPNLTSLLAFLEASCQEAATLHRDNPDDPQP